MKGAIVAGAALAAVSSVVSAAVDTLPLPLPDDKLETLQTITLGALGFMSWTARDALKRLRHVESQVAEIRGALSREGFHLRLVDTDASD